MLLTITTIFGAAVSALLIAGIVRYERALIAIRRERATADFERFTAKSIANGLEIAVDFLSEECDSLRAQLANSIPRDPATGRAMKRVG